MISVQMLHHENQYDEYFYLAFESLKNQSYEDWELILIDSSEKRLWIEDPRLRHYPVPHDWPGVKAANYAASLANPRAKYFVFSNDDVIYSKYALEEMANLAGDQDVIVDPFSNDAAARYVAEIDIQNEDGKKLEIKYQMRINDLKEFIPSIMNYPRGPRIAFYTHNVNMFGGLIPRKTYEKIGPYDEQFENSHADTDFAFRCVHLKIPMVVCVSAFVWHFGGVTTKERSVEDRNRDIEKFRKKWNL